MSAILKEDPPDLSVTNQAISPGLERIVRHCLEKNPEQRFHSAHDLAFDLETISGTSSAAVAPLSPALAGRRRRLLPAALAALAAALIALAFWAGRRSHASDATAKGPDNVLHQRLTFRRGNVLYARFTADGQSVVYGAAWGDRPAEIFLARAGSPESRPLGIAGANLLAVSPSGELAILLKKTNVFGTAGAGTLARVPIGGGTPREILEDVRSADWSPDGKELAVLREIEGKTVIEYPIGKRIAAGGLGMPRVSPDGSRIAALAFDQASAWISVFDKAGNRKELAKGFTLIDTMAWHPSGREIWFAGVSSDTFAGVFAVDLSGKVRRVGATTDLEVLHDIARDGRVLVERELNTHEVRFSGPDGQERDLSWLDQSRLASLSADGKTLLFSEDGEGGGPAGSVYLRGTDGSPAVRLGDGRALDLSPDGKWVLTQAFGSPGNPVMLLPTGAGQPRPVTAEGMEILGASFLPDGKGISIAGIEPGHGSRGYVMDLSGGKPRAFTPEGLTGGGAVSPDGTLFALNGPDGRARIYPVDGSEPRLIAGLEPKEEACQWSADGSSLFVVKFGEIPLKVFRLHLATGKKELWKALAPQDRAGLIRIEQVAVTPDGKSYAYSYNRVPASDLYIVTGWK